jgi:hypothetical protein
MNLIDTKNNINDKKSSKEGHDKYASLGEYKNLTFKCYFLKSAYNENGWIRLSKRFWIFVSQLTEG